MGLWVDHRNRRKRDLTIVTFAQFHINHRNACSPKDSREPTEAARPLRCDALFLSSVFGHQFLPPTVNQKALRSSSGSLVRFAAICRASTDWSPSGATQRYVRNRGRSGSARLALETTLTTHRCHRARRFSRRTRRPRIDGMPSSSSTADTFSNLNSTERSSLRFAPRPGASARP
jgi:hypothetical protein